MPQDKLFQYLKSIGDGSIAKETPDCSVTDFEISPQATNEEKQVLQKTKLISTTDFFYPLVEDPYMQGRISCCNVLSDVYAMGLSRVDHMLMILGISLQMRENDREVVTREMMRGFNDCAEEAGASITGGQSIMNPWPMIGGVANVMCREDEYIRPNYGRPGDLLVLTKPLGTQPAVNYRQRLAKEDGREFFEARGVSEEAINHAYLMAIESMGTLNRNSAKLMQKYGARGATDVTGFGLKGHTENLAAAQIQEVDLIIHSLPILADMETPIDGMHDFKVRTGSSAETSGGLLVMLGQAEARQFIEESESEFGQASWVVGEVVRGTRQALIREDAEVISIRDSFLKQL